MKPKEKVKVVITRDSNEAMKEEKSEGTSFLLCLLAFSDFLMNLNMQTKKEHLVRRHPFSMYTCCGHVHACCSAPFIK